ncbi:MAG: hypothetical protein ACOX83_01595 [Candidatus Spyradocola sp.]|jgi:hypothetical protein
MIAIDVSLALEILDDFTGRLVKPAQVRFTLDGQEMHPIAKPDGWFLFVNQPAGEHALTVEGTGFQREELRFQGGPDAERVETLRLLPSPAYRFSRRVTTLALRLVDKKKAPLAGRTLYRLGGDRQSLRLAQDDAGPGSTALRLFSAEQQSRLPVPGPFYLEDGKTSELIQLCGAEGALYTLGAPLASAHRRGCLLRPARAVETDAEGRAFLALPEAAEVVLLVPGKKGLALERVALEALAHNERDLVAD